MNLSENLDQYRNQLEILNQASVMINSAKEIQSILRISALAALELWKSDGGAAGIVKDGKLFFDDWYWKGKHHKEPFRCDILNDLRKLPNFMGFLPRRNGSNGSGGLPRAEDVHIRECLAVPIYGSSLQIQACLLLFNPDRSFFDRNLIDNPLPGLISSVAIALDHNRNLMDLYIKEEALEASLHEKEILLKEIHHRVKNNLQAIVGLLQAHLGTIKDPVDRQVFLKGQGLAMSISMIHELLYSSEDFSKIDFDQYTSQLVQNSLDLYPGVRNRVRVVVELNGMCLNADTAVPISLIINELLSNALIHAFPGGRSGKVLISMKEVGRGQVQLQVSDDGVGIRDKNSDPVRQTLGLNLVRSLVENLHGTMEMEVNGGTCFTMRFKEYFECENLELG
ncbi:MAG: sensor histidine kinase [bacterium]|nr:MAG: sensor histidine kinase [bacterium]